LKVGLQAASRAAAASASQEEEKAGDDGMGHAIIEPREDHRNAASTIRHAELKSRRPSLA
jgi:hypothetical protein